MKVTEEVVLPDVFNLNDSVMNKNHRDQAQFSPEKITLGKETRVKTTFKGAHILICEIS